MNNPILHRKVVAPLYAFELERLQGEGALESALQECLAIINLVNFESVVEDLLTKPGLLQLVISVAGDTPPLCAWILSRFPSSASSFATSLAFKILNDLSLSILFLDYPFSEDIKRDMSMHRQSVELGTPVIQALVPLLDPKSGVFRQERGGEEKVVKTKKNRDTQRNAKRAKNVKYLEDDTPFGKFGVSVPDCREDAEELVSDILAKQKAAMEFYFANLKQEGISDVLKIRFVPPSTSIREFVQRASVHEPQPEGPEPYKDRSPSAYPMVQPMKAALYFDSVKEFGEWRILVATNALKDLRETRKKNPSLFKIILKKIQELSKGYFSDDNQKRLNGSSADIPVYEAKMTRDSRLVYTIDCTQDYDSDREQQVIRIFGIYTHAQLNTRSWVAVGKQLAQEGREYRRRCNFRCPPHHAGDSVIPPATFPVQTDSMLEPSPGPLQLPQEDLVDLHSILVLNKYVTFSQEFLNTIIADQDVNHVFHVSAQEKEIIEHVGSCYVLGRSGTGKTTTMLFKMLGLERSWNLKTCKNEVKKPRQVFVTKSRVLAGKVSEYFLKLLDSLSTAGLTPKQIVKLAEKRRSERYDAALYDRDDDKQWNENIPPRFSMLQDEHFPLFITFDDLCDLIEGDIEEAQVLHDGSDHTSVRAELKRHRRRRPITYTDFLQSYWPHFAQGMTKGLSPSLVFSEIMGTIQGSYEALICEEHYLDQDTYENLSIRTQPMFASQREMLYDLYLRYLKYKRERREYDIADRAHLIVDYIRNNSVPWQKIDFLYVDEAQDNLLIDAFVLRALCKTADSLFWAGDTAQTISIGSSFRFDDLKALLFRVENENKELHQLPRRTKEPRTFQLTVNYRSHGGIVNAAHAIIQLITKFWPYSIDHLPREKGVVDGPKPVFFHGWDQDSVRYEQFLFGESGSHVEFGANQCILVRDEAAKDRFCSEVGKVGIIMTVYEAKGLEFEDVLLYNFFQDSVVDRSIWRIVLKAIEGCAIPAPSFDENRHVGVCSELKSLYVAITRARKNMWIADRSEKSEPMRAFWESKNLVQNCTPSDDVPRLAVSSSAEEWAEQAQKLFDNKRYSQSMHCFVRASRPREAAVANAFFLRERARNMPVTQRDAENRTKAFIEAADAFIACDGQTIKEKRIYLRNAGECFASAGDNCRAAESYLSAEEFTLAAHHYHKGSMVDEAVNIVKSHADKIEEEVAETIVGTARIYYFKEEKMDQAKDLFTSDGEALAFTEDYDLDIARVTLLESMRRIGEAAELHLAEGRPLEAIDLLLKDTDNPKSLIRAYECIMQGLWRYLSFGVQASVQRNETVIRLLQLASQLDIKQLDQSALDEIVMFQAIFSGDRVSLEKLGLKFHKSNNPICALLCLDHFFAEMPLRMDSLRASDLSRVLETFSIYVWLLNTCIQFDPRRNQSVQKLFNIQISSENAFLIPADTYLHQILPAHKAVVIQQTEKVTSISGWELWRIFTESLCDRLLSRVSEENDMCRQAKAFSPPCLTFAVYGDCRKELCPKEHVNTDPKSYNLRVRLHLQQILIYQTLHGIERRSKLVKQRCHWIGRLYDTLNPPYHHLGTRAILDTSTIPEADRGLRIVNDWVRYVLYSLNPIYAPDMFLTLFMKAGDFCFSLGILEYPDYVHRLPCITRNTSGLYLREPEGRNVMQDLLENLSASRPFCLLYGVLFLRHIVQKKLPVDIGVLCNFVDQLCMSYIVAERYRRTASLHGILVPRNWFSLIRLTDAACKRDTRTPSLFTLVDALAECLQQMYAANSPGYFFHVRTSADVSRLGKAIRGTFIDRFCMALCLLGDNIGYLRDKITFVITSLQAADSQFPSYCRSRYAYVQDWGELSRVVRRSAQNSLCDEMIQLCHESKTLPPIPSVRKVLYSNVNDIPSRVRCSHLPSRSWLRADAKPFVPAIAATPHNKNANKDVEVVSNRNTLPETSRETIVEPEDSKVDVPTDEEDVSNDQAMETAALSGTLDIPQSMDAGSGSPSSEEVRAAGVIASAFKRVLSRRKGAAKAGLTASREAIYEVCRAEARKMVWPKNIYRLLFLGPLVHALLCLEVIKTHLLSLKHMTKKRLKDARYDELERLGKTLTELTLLQKVERELQENLRPQSDLHRRRDIYALKCHIRELQAFVDELGEKCPYPLPPQLQTILQDELQIAVKSIVTGKTVKKKPKPELCMDDIYGIEDIYD